MLARSLSEVLLLEDFDGHGCPHEGDQRDQLGHGEGLIGRFAVGRHGDEEMRLSLANGEDFADFVFAGA